MKDKESEIEICMELKDLAGQEMRENSKERTWWVMMARYERQKRGNTS